MVKLAEYSRTATFAWSHGKIPSLVTGTASGTVDANFSSESSLELWSLLSADASKPDASLAVDAKFNDLDWSQDNKILAGALDNGAVELFSNPKDSLKFEASFRSHSKSAKTVRFNAKQCNILASSGTQGEIFIWDLNTCLKNPDYKPLTPGSSMNSIDEITSLAWNQCLAHVFASAGSSAYASIWDLKAKKEVIHLSYSSPETGLKSQLSVVEWHPKNSTRVATATGSDTDPLILVWDLRNANTPLQTLSKGHSKGILSLDWCSEDENLLLSSGRDNTIVLWNPESGEELTQYPTRGNWCFKTKFAPDAPDLFASASFDNKIQVQTLQNLVTTLDQEQSVTKQQESETDFWNHVSQEESDVKPTVLRMQAPSWYENKSPAAHWAFGGKLVCITANGLGVSITKPKLPGLEDNALLDEALKSHDFNPLINRRLAKTIDETNEEDWNLLEKLSMDGKSEFLKDSFAFDEEESDTETDRDDGENFFANIEGKFEPTGKFSLSNESEIEIAKYLVSGNPKAAVAASLGADRLLEALIISLDSNDKALKDSVKNAYFSKYGKDSTLSRFLHSISQKNSIDLVENLDVSQWKYAARAINNFYATDITEKNKQLSALADKLLESEERQDALVLYLAADSLDKVAALWLKEFYSLEQKLQKEKSSLYEAHSECLSEFVERFTVFSNFVGDNKVITNADLISKFLEYVNLASAGGNFDLAHAILETLPETNNEVKMENERVLLALGKAKKSTSKAHTSKAAYGAVTSNSIPLAAQQGIYRAGGPSGGSFINGNQIQAAPFVTQQNRVSPAPPVDSFTPQPNVHGFPVVPNAIASKYAPSVTSPSLNTGPKPIAVQPNAYTLTGMNAFAPLSSKPVPNFISAPNYSEQFSGSGIAPPSSVASGQTPSLNKKANDGWNDLPLDVKERPQRAKAGNIAPASITRQTSTPGISGTSASGLTVPPPPLSKSSSRLPSLVSQLPPPIKGSRKTSVSSNASLVSNSPKIPASSPYAPQPAVASSIAPNPTMSYEPAPQPNGTMANANPYAPPVTSNKAAPPANAYAPPVAASLPSRQSSPYAPPQQPPIVAGQMSSPMSSFTNGSASAPPVAASRPPPTNVKKKNHNITSVQNASTLLESVQKSPDGSMASTQSNGNNNVSLATSLTSPVATAAKLTSSTDPQVSKSASSRSGVPEDQQPIVDFLKEELARVTPLIPKEYTKQLKDCNKRLNILFHHLERQDLLTQPTIEKLKRIVELLKDNKYSEAMQVHVDIATNYAQEAGNWLTGVKRLIGIAEATST